MATIEIEPELTRCVHTAVREMYQDRLGKLLDNETKNSRLQDEITMLTTMLK